MVIQQPQVAVSLQDAGDGLGPAPGVGAPDGSAAGGIGAAVAVALEDKGIVAVGRLDGAVNAEGGAGLDTV